LVCDFPSRELTYPLLKAVFESMMFQGYVIVPRRVPLIDPLKNMLVRVRLDHFPKVRGENEKIYLKPPTIAFPKFIGDNLVEKS